MIEAAAGGPAALYHRAIVEAALRAGGSGRLKSPDAGVRADAG